MSGIGLTAVPDDVGLTSPLYARWRAIASSPATTDILIGVSVALVWAFGHTFVGIEGDSRIYMGRALADLDPNGIGRDIMFAMDGQSSFTLFRPLARLLVAAAGFGPAVAILSFVNLAVWFAAIATLVRAIAPGRALALVLAVAFVLPRLYTPWNLLAAGESIPVPRPLAEAGVLFALAAFCHGRLVLGTFCLVGAAAFHPIMAAPGFGILLVLLGQRDRRWFLAAGLFGLVGLAAAAMGLPILSRATVTIDPTWADILLTRNPYLFLHLWPIEGIAPHVTQLVTIAIGAAYLDSRARLVFLASVAVAALGCIASALFGDLFMNLLAVQAQLWRALWLPAVLATVAAGLCLWHLPSEGARGHLTLAPLCLAWLASDMCPLGPLAALCAAAAFFGGRRLTLTFSPALLAVVWITCAALAAGSLWTSLSVLTVMNGTMPEGHHTDWTMIWALRLPVVPIVLLALAWWRWPEALATRAAAAVSVPVLAIALYFVLDMRTPAHRDADAATLKPDLAAMVASRPGAVLWIDGDDVWYWLRRPNWNGMTQGGGLVFSRDLAMTWKARAHAMADHGLATRYFLEPWRYPISQKALTLDAGAIGDFCRRPDAPAWIIASLDPESAVPAGLEAKIWSPPSAHAKPFINTDTVRWRRLDRYAVIPCAPAAL